MSLGINFFAGGREVSSTKKWMKKGKFGELSTDEIQEIMDNAVPVTAQKLQSSRLDYLAVRIVSFKS